MDQTQNFLIISVGQTPNNFLNIYHWSTIHISSETTDSIQDPKRKWDRKFKNKGVLFFSPFGDYITSVIGILKFVPHSLYPMEFQPYKQLLVKLINEPNQTYLLHNRKCSHIQRIDGSTSDQTHILTLLLLYTNHFLQSHK